MVFNQYYQHRTSIRSNSTSIIAFDINVAAVGRELSGCWFGVLFLNHWAVHESPLQKTFTTGGSRTARRHPFDRRQKDAKRLHWRGAT